jgi:D-sedoheptulose 7-phosphate isomerase
MDQTIEQFRDHYADELAFGVSKFLLDHGQLIIRRLLNSLASPHSTIYLFGNGGSHAISKCYEYALQAYACSRKLRVRVQTGVDVHKATLLVTEGRAGSSFVDVLKTESADGNDLVVLISGSGNSDNLCEVARFAEQRGIPVIALLGSGGGRLSTIIPAADCFSVPLVDQQISEDIIQSLAGLIDLDGLTGPAESWERAVSAYTRNLQNAIRQVPSSFISRAAEAITYAFFNRKHTWVLGFEHPALSVCAEHVAHNLYWDAIYEVADPPQRMIFSSPTACDFSGISNDRRRGIVEILTGLSQLEDDGVGLMFSMTDNHPALLSLCDRFRQSGIPAFLLCGEGQIQVEGDVVNMHRTGLRRPQLQALVAQTFGHMLGRLIRMRLIESRGAARACNLSNPVKFLVDFDLAQRRLLDA